MKYIYLSFLASFIAVLHINAYDTVIDNFYYSWDANSYDGTGNWGAITMFGYKDYSKLSEDLVIPSSVKWNTSSKGLNGRMCRVSRVYEAAFSNCSKLKSVKLPYVRRVHMCAFENCVNIKKIHFSDAIRYIESSAFAGCSSLLQIIMERTEPPSDIAEDAFDNDVYNKVILYVPSGTINAYKHSAFWGKFSNITDATPADIYNLNIVTSGYGSVSYNGVVIRNQTKTFSVNGGSLSNISFTPDEGYRIKSLKVNNTDVTSSITNNTYTISSITKDTSVEVVFEAITHTLSIKATGNGSATYSGSSVRAKTSTFTVNEGTSATITFTPDKGYRIKSVKVNNTDITSSITNNAYTINSIVEDTFVEVVFEVISHTLSIKATGNGSATYSSTSVRGKTSTFTVNEGVSATIAFIPDEGHRVKNLKVNNTDVTSSITNNAYTISSISEDTSVEVVFEAMPTYTLKITSTGNGSASYNGTAIRAKTSSFIVYEGASVTVVFTPDNGYRIANVKVNDQEVTAGVNNNRYTISSITANTTMSVSFEEIPPTTYSLSITATGNGSVTYSNTTLKNQTQSFTVTEGSYATIAISPENGYRIKSIIQNGVDKTAAVDNNQFTTSKITNDMTVEVEFEAIPIPTYTLSITASGNGTANFLSTAIKNQTQSFSIEEGTAVTITFNPEDGNSVEKVVVKGVDITTKITGNRYVIESMSENTIVEVTFMEDINALTIDGVNYSVTSQQSRTIVVVGGNYGKVLEVPASVTQNSITWRVMGVEEGALSNNSELAAIIWNPEVAFTASVNNPNLLLYVKDAQYAPTAIHNVVVNGNANDIVLTDAGSGNNFYCPQAFTAQHISYTHNYQMQTGVDDVKGWETIVLPFDVQTISHEVKGSIKPFAAWNSGDVEKPFWLYELTGSGFVPTNSIKAYTPYIISMPNNPQYNSEWQLNGNVTFAASSVTIEKTEDVQKPSFKDRTFVPCFETKDAGEGLYALNVRNLYESNCSGMPDGSMFVLNMRKVHPFEAYLTTSSMARQFIGIFDDMTTDIPMMESIKTLSKETVYDLQGRKTTLTNKKGVYIVNGKKIIK